MGNEFTNIENRQLKLSALKGCLLWGERVIVQQSLWKQVLETLHVGHPEIVRMKAVAQSYILWPNLDWDIMEWVAVCMPCQET